MAVSALARSTGLLLTLSLLLGLGLPAPEPLTPALAAQPATRVRLGVLGTIVDAGFYIGLDQGYFREQGLDLEMIPFDSGARMVAPLGTGQLDAGGGAHSAGMFNAVARGVALKLVADKGSSPPGHGVQALLFRRDLAESGQVRSPADLRGRRVAISARGATTETALALWLRPYGLALDDVETVELGFGEHPSALAGRSVDAAVTIEPFVTGTLDQGSATLYQRTDEIYPGYQNGEVIYSSPFAQEQADAAQRFMLAYLRAVRFYNDAFARGDLARRQEAIASLARHTAVRDLALYERMVMPGLDPTGHMSVASIREDQEFWLASGLQQTRIDIDQVVDHSFADAAVQVLGPYQ